MRDGEYELSAKLETYFAGTKTMCKNIKDAKKERTYRPQQWEAGSWKRGMKLAGEEPLRCNCSSNTSGFLFV